MEPRSLFIPLGLNMGVYGWSLAASVNRFAVWLQPHTLPTRGYMPRHARLLLSTAPAQPDARHPTEKPLQSLRPSHTVTCSIRHTRNVITVSVPSPTDP